MADPAKQIRFESMLFNYETTGRTDFRDGEITTPVKTLYKPKPKRIRGDYDMVKYIQSVTQWRQRPPFSLFIKPRGIVQTNPRNVQQKYEKPLDLEREEVQKSRPRQVMTPAVSMDDIEDPKLRDILVKDMYTSDMTAKMREAVAPYLNVKAPYPEHPARADPVSLAKWHPPYVSKDWLMDSITWDLRQLRSFVAPTREFWLCPEHTPHCSVCEQEAVRTRQREMMLQLIQKKR
ncbi:uncharacterized protein LOC126370953 [Pectinophora gossypiella]|uniref:uncharacterized protein LOC126370953 n=1 Tax=Pectinophora gossypiella TaxID=13191 RepID=UPI00214EB802|nr:uncharacterized protein LOC126370953 [Pectinophora gossypiella]